MPIAYQCLKSILFYVCVHNVVCVVRVLTSTRPRINNSINAFEFLYLFGIIVSSYDSHNIHVFVKIILFICGSIIQTCIFGTNLKQT